METTSIILAGMGVIQSLLLLLFIPTEEKMNATVEKDFDNFMKLKEGGSSNQRAKDFIQYISDDKFDNEIYTNSQNWAYLAILKNLKETIVKFYFKQIKDMEELNPDLERVADIDNRIAQFMIQLMRLRMVIKPEVQISNNVHPRTDLNYLAIKAYWIDDYGKKVRKFTKSIGRAENYPLGIKDPKAMVDGIKLVQPVIYEHYKELYPK